MAWYLCKSDKQITWWRCQMDRLNRPNTNKSVLMIDSNYPMQRFPLGKFATGFQTEIHAILQCACENIRKAYKHQRIPIFSDSQAALQALSSPQVSSWLVAECLDGLCALASLNAVNMFWVPGHCGIAGSEGADKFARQASDIPLLGPQPAVGIPGCAAREAIKNWTEYQHYSARKDLPGHKHGKPFYRQTM